MEKCCIAASGTKTSKINMFAIAIRYLHNAKTKCKIYLEHIAVNDGPSLQKDVLLLRIDDRRFRFVLHIR